MAGLDNLSDLDDNDTEQERSNEDEEEEYGYDDDDEYEHLYPESFMHDQYGIENLAREMLKKYDWRGNDDITKEDLIRELADEMHDQSSVKPYEVRKDDWKNVLFVLKRSCPDDNDKTYDSWISAIISYMQGVIDSSNASEAMKLEYKRLQAHVSDMANRAKAGITPEYKIPSRMTKGRRQLLMSLIWLFTRKGQVIDLDKVPYSTIDLVKPGTKRCMTAEEVEEEKEADDSNEYTDELHAPSGFISGLESALTKPLHSSYKRQAPKHCDSGHWSGQIRKFTKSDKDMFDELWGTRLDELHNYIHSKEKQLTHKEQELDYAERSDDINKDVNSIEADIKALNGRITWCHKYLKVGNRVSNSDAFLNWFAELTRKFSDWTETERVFWGGIVVATDAEHLDARNKIFNLGVDTVRLSGNQKAIHNAESAKDLLNITSALGSVTSEHNKISKLKEDIEQEKELRDDTTLSKVERDNAKKKVDALQKDLDISRKKRVQGLQLSTAAATNFAKNATYLDKSFTPEQRKKIAADAQLFAENAGDFARITQMNEDIAREQDKLKEIHSELDNPAIDRDPARKSALEAQAEKLGNDLIVSSEKIANETNKVILKYQPCPFNGKDCQSGQKCLDPKGNPYTEEKCKTLVGKDSRKCSWSGHACEVEGKNVFDTTQKTSEGLQNLYTKGDIKTANSGYPNNNRYHGMQFGDPYARNPYTGVNWGSPRRRKSRLRGSNKRSPRRRKSRLRGRSRRSPSRKKSRLCGRSRGFSRRRHSRLRGMSKGSRCTTTVNRSRDKRR